MILMNLKTGSLHNVKKLHLYYHDIAVLYKVSTVIYSHTDLIHTAK